MEAEKIETGEMKEEKMEPKEMEEAECKTCKTMDQEARKAWTTGVTKNHALLSMGIGFIPIPVVDFVALTGVQLRLLNKLSKFYGVTFSKEKGKKIIASLIGGYLPVSLGRPFYSLIKAVPVIGQTAGVLAMPAIAGATTYALGKVFVRHFESGGTLLDFDPPKMKKYFQEHLKEGKEVVGNVTKNVAAAVAG
jgi:uncharacterized protein (DUF697 family)